MRAHPASPFPALIPALFLMLCVPLVAQTELATTFSGIDDSTGNMFDVDATNTITVRGFELHLDSGVHDIEVFVPIGGGSHVGLEMNMLAWMSIGSATGVASEGPGRPTRVPILLNETILAGSTLGFYVTTSDAMKDSTGTAVGNPAASDLNVTIREGQGGNVGPFMMISATRVWNGTLLYDVGLASAFDLALIEISSPTTTSDGCSLLSASESVSITLQNVGTSTVSSGATFLAQYSVNGGLPVFDVVTIGAPLLTYGQATFTFSTNADLSAPGAHQIDVLLSPNDDDPSNDHGSVSVQSGAIAVSPGNAFYEGFDIFGAENESPNPPPGWVQSTADNNMAPQGDWHFQEGSTPSSTTGPGADNTTCEPGVGFYMHIEDSSSEHASIVISSPCLALAAATAASCSFWVHSFNGNQPAAENMMSLDVLDVTSATLIPDVVGPIGHLGNEWTRFETDLSSFAGKIIQLQFRGRTNNMAFSHDIAVDDVLVSCALPGGGQAPQSSAELDINAARNDAGNAVAPGFAGPFFTGVPNGGTLTFTFRGLPNQPVILFTGPLNPGVKPLGLLGQLDLGFVQNPCLVTGVAIVADGSMPGFLNLFFNTGPSGANSLSFGLPALLSDTCLDFQCIILSGAPVSFSNTVSVKTADVIIFTIQPPVATEGEAFKIIGTGFDPANSSVFAGDMAVGEVLEDSTSDRLNVELGPVWMQKTGPVRIMEGTISTETGTSHITADGSALIESGGATADGCFDVTINDGAKEVVSYKTPPFTARKRTDNEVYDGTANSGQLEFTISGDASKKARVAVTLCLHDGSECYTIITFSFRISTRFGGTLITNEQIAAHVAHHIDAVSGIDASSNTNGKVCVGYTSGTMVAATSTVRSTIRVQ